MDPTLRTLCRPWLVAALAAVTALALGTDYARWRGHAAMLRVEARQNAELVPVVRSLETKVRVAVDRLRATGPDDPARDDRAEALYDLFRAHSTGNRPALRRWRDAPRSPERTDRALGLGEDFAREIARDAESYAFWARWSDETASRRWRPFGHPPVPPWTE